jgi:hypothetical protein
MISSLILAATLLSITAILCVAGLRAWNGWLALKRLELERARADGEDKAEDDVGLRIELAAVRERLKKLEAIASGVEL